MKRAFAAVLLLLPNRWDRVLTIALAGTALLLAVVAASSHIWPSPLVFYAVGGGEHTKWTLRSGQLQYEYGRSTGQLGAELWRLPERIERRIQMLNRLRFVGVTASSHSGYGSKGWSIGLNLWWLFMIFVAYPTIRLARRILLARRSAKLHSAETQER